MIPPHSANAPDSDPLPRAIEAFLTAFGHKPTWAASAPGRVNLIGEHTDYNDGFVLPIAIDRRGIAVGATAGDPTRSRIIAADLGRTAEWDLRRPLHVGEGPGFIRHGTWESYIAGVAAQFQRLPGPAALANIDLAVASSVPLGGGLSSSASLEVAVATLLEQATGVRLDPKAKALACQRAEHEFAGVPCGIMDQFVSVMGRAGHALLIDCRSQEATAIPIPDEAEFLVINSNIRHVLAGGEYAARRMACEAAAEALGLTALRDADLARLEASRDRLGDVQFRRARHVVTENGRTLEAAEALRGGDLSRMGRLMHESHESLRLDYEVSCPELDTLVELLMRVDGVHGARMTGGGFGGCVVVLGRHDATTGIARELPSRYSARCGRECSIAPVRANDGARAVPLSLSGSAEFSPGRASSA